MAFPSQVKHPCINRVPGQFAGGSNKMLGTPSIWLIHTALVGHGALELLEFIYGSRRPRCFHAFFLMLFLQADNNKAPDLPTPPASWDTLAH